jgi:hypothetical protein
VLRLREAHHLYVSLATVYFILVLFTWLLFLKS